MNYEYGIAHHQLDIDNSVVKTVHRKGMTELEVDRWLAEWEEDTGLKPPFVKIKRPISEWEIVK